DPERSWLSTLTTRLHMYLLEPILTVLRAGELLVYFVPVLLCYPAMWLGRRRFWYRLLRMQMSRAGPTFVKLAQWAASRTDLFESAMCEELALLHDANTQHSIEHSHRQVCQMLDIGDISEVFAEFEPEALGAGAVAQVHYARLHPEYAQKMHMEETVAVKVLHPNMACRVSRDLRIMHWGAVLLSLLPGMSWLSLPEEVCVFGDMMQAQLDLRTEAYNLGRFRANFSHRPGVRFPQPYKGSRQVLIESFEDGVPLRAFLDSDKRTLYDRGLGARGLDAFLQMLIADNFVHADLHPGNILVRLRPPFAESPLDRFIEEFFDKSPFRLHTEPLPSSQEAHQQVRALMAKGQGLQDYMSVLYANGYAPELVLLDCGLATELDSASRRNFLDLFQAVCEFNGAQAGQLMISRCRTPSLVIGPDIFVLRIQDIILKVRAVSFRLSKLTFGDIFAPVLQAVRTHHVRLEPAFTNIIMAMFVLEGVGRRLDPESDILKAALPLLRQWLKAEGSQGLVDWHVGKVWLYIEVREY
ncbi:ABC1-domain-containing protein, partial [Linderina pennispora]